jgi:hypothetical protein
MFSLETSFNPLLFKGGRNRIHIEVTVHCKEGDSTDFCPNYVQEFGLRLPPLLQKKVKTYFFCKFLSSQFESHQLCKTEVSYQTLQCNCTVTTTLKCCYFLLKKFTRERISRWRKLCANFEFAKGPKLRTQ